MSSILWSFLKWYYSVLGLDSVWVSKHYFDSHFVFFCIVQSASSVQHIITGQCWWIGVHVRVKISHTIYIVAIHDNVYYTCSELCVITEWYWSGVNLRVTTRKMETQQPPTPIIIVIIIITIVIIITITIIVIIIIIARVRRLKRRGSPWSQTRGTCSEFLQQTLDISL